MADAFEVHDARARLVEHLVAVFAQAEGEVAVLAIGRHVALVETAQRENKARGTSSDAAEQ